MNKYLILLFFVIIVYLLAGCRNNEVPTQGTLLFADRDSLLKVDLQTKKQDILYKTSSQQFWLANPTYNKKNELIAIEECNAIDQRCRIVLLDRMGDQVGIYLSDINPNSFPAWSPDGELQAIQVKITSPNVEDIVYKVAIFNKQGNKIATIERDSGGGQISWAPDGKNIAFSTVEEEVVIVNYITGESFLVGKGGSPIFFPNSKLVAYLTNGEIRMFDLQKKITSKGC